MALPMVPIYTQTVGAGGAASVTFNNIPQFYTDLKIAISVRTTQSTYLDDNLVATFNGSSSGYSLTYLYGNGSSTGSGRGASQTAVLFGRANGSTSTASTFSNIDIYIPNYSSSNSKQIIVDSVSETNAAGTFLGLFKLAGLWQNNSGISSIAISASGGNFVQYTTVTLYGILRAGA